MMMFIALAAVAAQPALREQDVVRDSVTVSYGDLDLAGEAGQRHLQQRMARAARRLCNDGGAMHLDAALAYQACVAATLSNNRHKMELAVARARGTNGSMAAAAVEIIRH